MYRSVSSRHFSSLLTVKEERFSQESATLNQPNKIQRVRQRLLHLDVKEHSNQTLMIPFMCTSDRQQQEQVGLDPLNPNVLYQIRKKPQELFVL